MSSMTLYDTLEDVTALVDSLDMCASPELRAQCEAEIERAVAAKLRKVDSFNRFLTHLDSQIELADKEIARLKTRMLQFEHLKERLELFAIRTMQAQNLRKVEGDTSRLTLRTNVPAVEITDEDAVPAEFKTIVTEVKIDKRLIKKTIDGGREVPGTHLKEPTVSLLRR